MSQGEFEYVYSKVPRLTVEILVTNRGREVYLTKRAIDPCKGLWHLPGGTVRFGEPLKQAVRRIARRELGIAVEECHDRGYIEYPSHYLNGLDSPVGIVFEVTRYTGQLTPNPEADGGGWFRELPEAMHGDQDVFLVDHGYLDAR